MLSLVMTFFNLENEVKLGEISIPCLSCENIFSEEAYTESF